MTALFKWNARSSRPPTQVGDLRRVQRFLFLPRCIGGEWRWLGWERIEQEAYMGWHQPPETKGYQGIKWRDSRWLA